jgi:hypothetical protein
MKLNTVIPEKHNLVIVIESQYGRFYQIGDTHECTGSGSLNTWIDLLKNQALRMDLDCVVYVVSCPVYEGPIVWDKKICKKATTHFSYNPKTGKANNYGRKPKP